MRALVVVFCCLYFAACSHHPLTGEWKHQNKGIVIGLDLKRSDECNLKLSRFLGNTLEKGCRYERNDKAPNNSNGEHYLIFLRDETGHCDVFADFEFVYEEQADVISFLVGDTPFLMKKAQ